MHSLSLQTVLWFGAQALELAILVSMYRRRIQEYYPAFFYYIILQVLSDPFLTLAQDRWPYTYYFAYWITACLSVTLSFFVLLEVFRDAFRPFEALRELSAILFRWAALVLLLVVGMSALNLSTQSNLDTLTKTILMVDRNVRVMLCGLVFFLVMFSEYLGISRRHLMFGVAVGFGFFSAIHMLIAMAVTHPTVLHRNTLSAINSGAYVIACLIWLFYVANPKTLLAGQTTAVSLTDQWNQALEDARAQIPTESLLDTMDQTVAELLTRLRNSEQQKVPVESKPPVVLLQNLRSSSYD
jgi:hypothetical protein